MSPLLVDAARTAAHVLLDPLVVELTEYLLGRRDELPTAVDGVHKARLAVDALKARAEFAAQKGK